MKQILFSTSQKKGIRGKSRDQIRPVAIFSWPAINSYN